MSPEAREKTRIYTVTNNILTLYVHFNQDPDLQSSPKK